MGNPSMLAFLNKPFHSRYLKFHVIENISCESVTLLKIMGKNKIVVKKQECGFIYLKASSAYWLHAPYLIFLRAVQRVCKKTQKPRRFFSKTFKNGWLSGKIRDIHVVSLWDPLHNFIDVEWNQSHFWKRLEPQSKKIVESVHAFPHSIIFLCYSSSSRVFFDDPSCKMALMTERAKITIDILLNYIEFQRWPWKDKQCEETGHKCFCFRYL